MKPPPSAPPHGLGGLSINPYTLPQFIALNVSFLPHVQCSNLADHM